MPTTAEIIFVGLCTLVNVRNQDTGPNTPPPAAVVMTHAGHKSFVAYDSGKVTMTGVTPTQISTSKFYMIEFLAEGEELTFNDDRTQVPAVDPSFDDVASFATYSRINSPAWITDFIPRRNSLPVKGNIAAYLEFGGGTLRGDRLTKRRYHFTPSTENPDPTKAKCFAREVHYHYDTTTDGLLIEARSLDTRVKRTMHFKPKGNSKHVEIWIGTSSDPLGDLNRVEPKEYKAGAHFKEFYRAEQLPDNAATDPLPRPIGLDCAGNAASLKNPPSVGEGDPEIGYCGPESKP